MKLSFFKELPIPGEDMTLLSDKERTERLILETSGLSEHIKKLIDESEEITRRQVALTDSLRQASMRIGIEEDRENDARSESGTG